jgi:CubicO group peptidase (beta-lactamase class C family)
MRLFLKAIFASLAFSLGAGSTHAADLFPERSASHRAGNWFFPSISAADLNQKTKTLGARIVDIEVVSTSPMRFDATLVKNGGPHTGKWWWYFGLTERRVNELTREKDARLIDVEVYRSGGRLRYAVVMKHDPDTGWFWFVGQTPASLKEKYREKNMRLIDVERYELNGRTRFAAIMINNTGANKRRWAWFVGNTRSEIAANLKDLKLRIVDLDRNGTAGGGRFDVVMAEAEGGGQPWWYYYDITRAEAVSMAVRHGTRIIDVERSRGGRVDVVLLDNGFARTGHCGGRLSHAVDKIEATMRRYQIPGAQIAVARDDRLVMSCAIGTADVTSAEKIRPDSLMRIMSVSKLITAMTVQSQILDGKYAASDTMLDALGDRAPALPYNDPRMSLITVEHLLNHMGGFYRNKPYDPMVRQDLVAEDMGDSTPLRCREIADYAIRNFPLEFWPGVELDNDEDFDRLSYSNLGYCILQQIIAEHDPGSYQRVVKRRILTPAGITGMRIARGKQEDRAEREVAYYDVPFAKPIKSQYADVSGDVPRPYSYVVEAMAGHGGWLASANDLVRFARFAPGAASMSHSGFLSGSESMLLRSGANTVAIIFNATTRDPDENFDISALAQSVIDDTDPWPSRDLWSAYGYPN